MIQIPRLPAVDGANGGREQQSLQAQALCGEDGVQFLHRFLQLRQCLGMLGMLGLGFRRNRLQRLASARPLQHGAPARNGKRCRAVAQSLDARPVLVEPESRHRHGLQILAADVVALRGLRERLLHEPARDVVLDAHRQAAELRDGIEPGHRRKRVDAGVAHAMRNRSDLRDLAEAGEGVRSGSRSRVCASAQSD